LRVPDLRKVDAASAFSQLNSRYVTQGVVRFINGQYATGHAWGFMLGYALALPADPIVQAVNNRLAIGLWWNGGAGCRGLSRRCPGHPRRSTSTPGRIVYPAAAHHR
jgi:hypothetical protein